MAGLSATCTRHPARFAVGVCVRCSAALCSDCITKLDGINHCLDCMSELGRRAHKAPAPRRGRLPEAASIAFGFALVCLLAWLMIEVIMPGSGSS